MRITSDFWVSAFLRRANAMQTIAYLKQRGAKEAGAIYLIQDHLNASYSFYAPAPQAIALDEMEVSSDRLFELVLNQVDQAEIDQRLMRERRFDPDIWVIEIEWNAVEPPADLAVIS
jgi:hypothetical protein